MAEIIPMTEEQKFQLEIYKLVEPPRESWRLNFLRKR